MDSRKDLNVLVGANIKREREKAGFTQDRFSELLGIGSKSLSSIERGVVGVSLPTLLRSCDILHISANVLLYEQARRNDVDNIALQLERLSAEQFEIASDVMTNLYRHFPWKNNQAAAAGTASRCLFYIAIFPLRTSRFSGVVCAADLIPQALKTPRTAGGSSRPAPAGSAGRAESPSKTRQGS